MANPVNDADWWRSAVVYQVYIRSFADGDGDGVGDIAGLRSRLPYLARLGVDAIWINPWYPSPMADGGYDVSDYRAIEPVFGTLDEADDLIAQAHRHGMKIILDIVPNHSSDQHPWFQAALASPPGSPERVRYVFRDGSGDGSLPPNNWMSVWTGSAWQRIVEADGEPGQWYLHLFSAEQPDFDWLNPEVQAEFDDVLRFWFDRGVDGFRIDVANSLAKTAGLPDVGPEIVATPDEFHPTHPHWDVAAVHEIYRHWRAVADEYDPPKTFVAEAWIRNPDRLALYVRSDELNTAFNFDFLRTPWHPKALRTAIDETLRSLGPIGAPPTWVVSNHDVMREVSRYARNADDKFVSADEARNWPADLALGQLRARAAALLMFALPGSAYIFQGGELGLPEVEDLPDEVLQDPVWRQSGFQIRGRDGCRVPLPWSGTASPFGFSPEGSASSPWLPMPDWFADYTVERQSSDAHSMLTLYRVALRLRRELPGLGDGAFAWVPSDDGVLTFTRGAGFTCLVNLSDGDVEVPDDATVLLASAELAGGMLLPDTAVWLATD